MKLKKDTIMNTDQRDYEAAKRIPTPELVKKLKESGSPTTGVLAAELWMRLSTPIFSPSIRESINHYHEAGYKPFCGYPLERLAV